MLKSGRPKARRIFLFFHVAFTVLIHNHLYISAPSMVPLQGELLTSTTVPTFAGVMIWLTSGWVMLQQAK